MEPEPPPESPSSSIRPTGLPQSRPGTGLSLTRPTSVAFAADPDTSDLGGGLGSVSRSGTGLPPVGDGGWTGTGISRTDDQGGPVSSLQEQLRFGNSDDLQGENLQDPGGTR